MTRYDLVRQVEGKRIRCHITGANAEEIVKKVFPEAEFQKQFVNPQPVTDDEIDTFVEDADPIIKQELNNLRLDMKGFLYHLGLR